MSIDEVRQLIQQSETTLATLRIWLADAMAAINSQPAEVEKLVTHGNRQRMVMRPNPALSRSRSILASIRAFENRLNALRSEEKKLTEQQDISNDPYAPKPR